MAEAIAGTCGVGARILAPTVPRAASLAESRWRARLKRSSHKCSEITDKAECCGALGKDADVCVPAVTSFDDGSVCQGWYNHLRFTPAEYNAVAACPPQEDLATKTSRHRVKLPAHSACDTVKDRVACCSLIDGRTLSQYLNAPCVPAIDRSVKGRATTASSRTSHLSPLISLTPHPPHLPHRRPTGSRVAPCAKSPATSSTSNPAAMDWPRRAQRHAPTRTPTRDLLTIFPAPSSCRASSCCCRAPDGGSRAHACHIPVSCSLASSRRCSLRLERRRASLTRRCG